MFKLLYQHEARKREQMRAERAVQRENEKDIKRHSIEQQPKHDKKGGNAKVSFLSGMSKTIQHRAKHADGLQVCHRKSGHQTALFEE